MNMSGNNGNKKSIYDKIVDWFDLRFGFTKTPLKPIPDFALNPIYWLGLLLALTFVMQGATGMFMLFYYVPSPAQAYSSTLNIINNVPLGHLVETLHLYGAYAMILLAFMHLARNYFGSAHKGNRSLMWVAGIALGLIVLTFGVTGYLLPWTVISKSATDVAVGFVNFFPPQLANIAKFYLTGSGSDADELNNFLHIHTVVLPAALILFLGLKIYMYEVHGPAYVPAFGKPKQTGGRIVRWFPEVFLYAVILFSIYIAILFAVASIFPISLPPGFSARTAGQYVVQPDWYLLWLYQILKIQLFEGPYAVYAIVAAGIFVALLLLLPLYDRSKRRDLSQRPLYVTVGVMIVAEFITLTVWGYLTPGRIIPDYQALSILGGVLVAVAILMWYVYRIRRTRVPIRVVQSREPPSPPSAPSAKPAITKQLAGALRSVRPSLLNCFTALFVLLLVVSSVSLATSVNLLPNLLTNLPFFGATVIVFLCSLYFMCRMLRGFVLAYEREVNAH